MSTAAYERRLMANIRKHWATTIAKAFAGTTYIEAFIAAIIANESAGNPDALRFEKHVYDRLRKVMRGEQAGAYGLSAKDLMGSDDQSLRLLATSWGLTQIMGFHTFRLGTTPYSLAESPMTQLVTTRKLLDEFRDRFKLNPASDFEQLLRCWNTGTPKGELYDPRYVDNALVRMKVYTDATP